MLRLKLLAILLVAAIFAGAGCYTVLRHPQTYDLTGEYYEQKSCADCHADADLYHYTERYGSGWYEYYPAPWAVYYQSPWWYEDYWYYTPDPNHLGSPPVTGDRTPWSRQIGPGSDPLPSQGKQKVDNPLPPDAQRSDPKEDEQKPAERREKKPRKRNIWGR